MYNKFQLAKKYLRYRLTAKNSKGHGIHSPFVFDFINKILLNNIEHECFEPIEKLRQQLIEDKSYISIEDLGAGSSVVKYKKRSIKDIATHSLKSPKYAQLLYRLVNYYRPQTIIELGTSFGITTAYMASANPFGMVYTCEGVEDIAIIADNNFDELELKNIKLIQGDFVETLPQLLSKLKSVNLAFIDGNHRIEPTLEYFNQFLKLATHSTILIFDDIHWSKEMEDAWQQIKEHPAVTLSIDIFFLGFVFFNPGFKVKQHFTIRF